jgi:hypothetical protein
MRVPVRESMAWCGKAVVRTGVVAVLALGFNIDTSKARDNRPTTGQFVCQCRCEGRTPSGNTYDFGTQTYPAPGGDGSRCGSLNETSCKATLGPGNDVYGHLTGCATVAVSGTKQAPLQPMPPKQPLPPTTVPFQAPGGR